jgi:hypothetical protein
MGVFMVSTLRPSLVLLLILASVVGMKCFNVEFPKHK